MGAHPFPGLPILWPPLSHSAGGVVSATLTLGWGASTFGPSVGALAVLRTQLLSSGWVWEVRPRRAPRHTDPKTLSLHAGGWLREGGGLEGGPELRWACSVEAGGEASTPRGGRPFPGALCRRPRRGGCWGWLWQQSGGSGHLVAGPDQVPPPTLPRAPLFLPDSLHRLFFSRKRLSLETKVFCSRPLGHKERGCRPGDPPASPTPSSLPSQDPHLSIQDRNGWALSRG